MDVKFAFNKKYTRLITCHVQKGDDFEKSSENVAVHSAYNHVAEHCMCS